MFSQGIVVDPSNGGTADGTTTTVNLGRSNELIVSELHGKYLEQCYRGNVYYGSTTTTGVVISIATTKTPTYTIWNPAGSGKLIVPIVTLCGWNATTAALGTVIWTATTSAGASIATTAPFVTFTTPQTPVNANLGSGKVSVAKFGNESTTISITAAASFYRSTGFTITPTTAATSVAPGWQWRDDWDGTSVIPPGNAIHLMGSTAFAAALCVTTVWCEIPL
jgi:hypothetical protein